MEPITTLLEERLSGLKKKIPDTLFPPDWEALKKSRCPLCYSKLKFPREVSIALCNSKKHGKNFIIKLSTLEEITHGLA